MNNHSIQAGNFLIKIEGDSRTFTQQLSYAQLEPGLDQVTLTLNASQAAQPPKLTLIWRMPIVDIHAVWHPGIGRNRALPPNWSRATLVSAATQNAPVLCLHSLDGRNRLSFAVSDALNPVAMKAGVVEESAEFECSVTLFSEPHPDISNYKIVLRLDSREVPYFEALDRVQIWWAELPGFKPASVPECARLPMYSTWYSFHQNLNPSEIEEQCALARQLGCEAVIVDDGWQNSDSNRGYASCGDWQPAPQRFSDLRAHVDRVHAIGMKFLLWYALPLIGKESNAFKRFESKLLDFNEGLKAGILDPRFSEVRSYLIDLCTQALDKYAFDGFKLDFVDCFYPSEKSCKAIGGGRDFVSVSEAADVLLSDLIKRLRAVKPEIMIEFRQSYIGPLMRKYGNMFRAGDCPNDAITNRMRTLDLRLLCGNTAAHADMLMWHPAEPVESAALQLLNVMFSVPQISVWLNKLPTEHMEMLKFWLGFWKQHRDALLDGALRPLHPEALYPVVIASAKNKRIAAVYDESVASFGTAVPKELFVINATRSPRVVVEMDEHLGARRFEVYDCRGNKLKDENRRFPPGAQSLPVPPAGLARITQ